MTYRHILLATVCGLATLAPISAAAQSDAAPPAGAGDTSANAEIIVTAQKRNERLVDVPISITAATGDQLADAGVSDTNNLAQVVPGFRMDSAGASRQPTIRGVGSQLVGPGLSANVATYIDGYYRPSLVGNSELFDVASVQVLKGPQGTLFGRNATGGAVLITTLGPQDEFDGKIQLQYGSHNEAKASLFLTGGLSETVSASLSGYYHRGDGFVENLVTGRDDTEFENYAVNAKLRFAPTDRLSFVLGLQYSSVDDPASQTVSAYGGIATLSLAPGAIVATERGDSSADVVGINRSTERAVTLTSRYDFDGVNLTSYTQYRSTKSHFALDLDAAQIPLLSADWLVRQKTFTQEC